MSEQHYEIIRLDWDSRKFGFEVFSLILYCEIDLILWKSIQKELKNAKLVYIRNYTLNRDNSRIIAEKTDAVIYDTNISFTKIIRKDNTNHKVEPANSIISMKNFNWNISDMLYYSESRFFKDKKITNVFGNLLYKEWVENSKNKDDKEFLFYMDNEMPIGFILYSFGEKITIELIGIHKDYQKKGLGTKLIKYLEKKIIESNFNEICVGTQISNLNAINFYIRNNYVVNETTDVYHWWRKG